AVEAGAISASNGERRDAHVPKIASCGTREGVQRHRGGAVLATRVRAASSRPGSHFRVGKAAGLGFEPREGVNPQRFSRPSRSTAPAPRRTADGSPAFGHFVQGNSKGLWLNEQPIPN